MATTNEKGKIAEAQILAAFVRAGVRVAIPFGGDSPYDLIAEINGKLFRVQVKWGRVVNGCVLFATAHQKRPNTTEGFQRWAYEDVDLFAVYSEQGESYLVPPEMTSATITQLRLRPTKNHQSSGVRFAANFTFEAILEQKIEGSINYGGLAQLGERLAGSQKVRGSSPLSST